MSDRSRPKAAPGSGGPVDSLLGTPDCDCAQATAWRMLCSSGHVLDLIAEFAEWDKRRVMSETSAQLSAAGSWRPRDSYAAIARRRLEDSPLFPGRDHDKPGWKLREEAHASWQKVERDIAARPSWL